MLQSTYILFSHDLKKNFKIYLFERVTQKGREREKEIFHLLGHFPDGHNRSWARPKSQVWNLLGICPVSTGAQALGPSSTACPEHEQSDGSEGGARSQIGASTECQHQTPTPSPNQKVFSNHLFHKTRTYNYGQFTFLPNKQPYFNFLNQIYSKSGKKKKKYN